uniref:Uncharacterized protein n=1 Tax=Rhizophora mucronata TaxID=61149 RepID=A0A2P2PLR8_RHIMU
MYWCKSTLMNSCVPVSKVSNRGPKFTSRFWSSLLKARATKLSFSTA